MFVFFASLYTTKEEENNKKSNYLTNINNTLPFRVMEPDMFLDPDPGPEKGRIRIRPIVKGF